MANNELQTDIFQDDTVNILGILKLIKVNQNPYLVMIFKFININQCIKLMLIGRLTLINIDKL